MPNHDKMYLPSDKMNHIEEMNEFFDFMLNQRRIEDENRKHKKEVKDFLRRYL